MMKSLFLTLFTLTCACASTRAVAPGELSLSQQRFTVVFDSTNQKIFGDAMLKYKGDLTLFTLDAYKLMLNSYTSNRPKELREAMKDFEVQKIQAYPRTFVFCVFSSKQKLAVCDDPQCTGVELKTATISAGIL